MILKNLPFPRPPVPGPLNRFHPKSKFLAAYGVTGLDKGLPYQTVNIPLTAGTHTLGFGSYDTSDTSVTTGLLIDNITTGAVPEPATATLAGLGIAGLMITRRRK